MRFRVVDEQGQIRPHIRFFVNGAQKRSLTAPLAESDEVMIVCALSGG
jgi:molybdopterin converting factor small subunit